MKRKNETVENKIKASVYANLSVTVAVVLLVLGGLALWANRFITNMVETELTAQKIYFPQAGSPALDPETYPDLQKYAGQIVDSAPKAKAYANGYIGRHLENSANGKVYSEVSTELRKDPTNEELIKQRDSLFMGETLRGILLGTGYAFGTIGIIAGVASWILFASAAVLVVISFYFRRKSS